MALQAKLKTNSQPATTKTGCGKSDSVKNLHGTKKSTLPGKPGKSDEATNIVSTRPISQKPAAGAVAAPAKTPGFGKSDSVKNPHGTKKSTLPAKPGKSDDATIMVSARPISPKPAAGAVTAPSECQQNQHKAVVQDNLQFSSSPVSSKNGCQLTDDLNRQMYLSPRISDDTSRIRKLEMKLSNVVEDVSRLKKKLRRLTDKIDSDETASSSVTRNGEGDAACNSGTDSSQDSNSAKGYTMSTLRNAIAHCSPENHREVLKILALKIFSVDELKMHSISGKRSVKSTDSPRPGLDCVRLETLESLVREKCPTMSHKDYVERLQNLQKVQRRMNNK